MNTATDFFDNVIPSGLPDFCQPNSFFYLDFQKRVPTGTKNLDFHLENTC